MKLIFLAGKARVGKTVLANAIAAWAYEAGFTPRLIGFADAIRKAAADEYIDRHYEPERYREFCQEYGQRMRDDDPDYWVKALETTVNTILADEERDLALGSKYWERVVVVDDCRYLNELALCRKMGGNIGFISQGKRKLEDNDALWRSHASEEMARRTEQGDKDYLDMFDHVIVNDQSKEKYLNPFTWMPLVLAGDRDDCPCELCCARREGREADVERIMEQLQEWKEDMDGAAD